MKEFDTEKFCGADNGRGYNMSTATGKPFWPGDPRPEDIRIEDIARHLSRLCRFNGALKSQISVPFPPPCRGSEIIDVEIYSVAQHSVLVCDHVTSDAFEAHNTGPRSVRAFSQFKLAALLHDAAEAYLGDMIKPVKSLHAGRKELEKKLDRVIEQRFGLPAGIMDHPLIKEQDCRAVLTEHRDLQENDGTDWGFENTTDNERPWPERIVPALPSAAYRMFMDRFNELYRGE